MDLTILETFWRFVVAAIAGGILGVPTQLRRRPGGIRTHALVSLGAALFCTTALAASGQVSGDLFRILQGIATGIGFIGGAAILRGDHVVQGINTAATIWLAGAVGSAISFIDIPAMGVMAAILATFINWLLLALDVRTEGRTNESDVLPGADARTSD